MRQRAFEATWDQIVRRSLVQANPVNDDKQGETPKLGRD